MDRTLGIVLLVVGVLLLGFGISSADSFASNVKQFFTGSPTDKAVWLMIGGAASLVVGLVLTLRGSRAIRA